MGGETEYGVAKMQEASLPSSTPSPLPPPPPLGPFPIAVHRTNDYDAFKSLVCHLLDRKRGSSYDHSTWVFRRRAAKAKDPGQAPKADPDAEGKHKLVELLVGDYTATVRPRVFTVTPLPNFADGPSRAAPTGTRSAAVASSCTHPSPDSLGPG